MQTNLKISNFLVENSEILRIPPLTTDLVEKSTSDLGEKAINSFPQTETNDMQTNLKISIFFVESSEIPRIPPLTADLVEKSTNDLWKKSINFFFPQTETNDSSFFPKAGLILAHCDKSDSSTSGKSNDHISRNHSKKIIQANLAYE